MTNNTMDNIIPIKQRTYRDIKKQRKPRKGAAVKPDVTIESVKPDTPKKKPHLISDEKIRELLAKGKNHVEIARLLRGSLSYIYARKVVVGRMKDMGLPVPNLRRGIGMQRKQRVYLMVQETVDQINELAGKTGMGKGEIIEKAVEKFKKDWENELDGI